MFIIPEEKNVRTCTVYYTSKVRSFRAREEIEKMSDDSTFVRMNFLSDDHNIGYNTLRNKKYSYLVVSEVYGGEMYILTKKEVDSILVLLDAKKSINDGIVEYIHRKKAVQAASDFICDLIDILF